MISPETSADTWEQRKQRLMKNRKAVGVQTHLTLPKGMGEQCRLLQDGVIKGKHGSYNKQAAKRLQCES